MDKHTLAKLALKGLNRSLRKIRLSEKKDIDQKISTQKLNTCCFNRNPHLKTDFFHDSHAKNFRTLKKQNTVDFYAGNFLMFLKLYRVNRHTFSYCLFLNQGQ